MKKTKIRHKKIKKILYFKILLSFFLISFYSLATFFSNPLFLIQDLQNKKGQVKGVFLSVDVSGAPNEPIVSASAICQEENPLVNLSWQEDSSVASYEITKNGTTLITGLLQNSYQDSDVINEESYTYQVIAHGQLHDATSQEVSVTTPNCEDLPSISCQITHFNKRLLATQEDPLQTKDRTPNFSGTTSLPQAIINITISGTSNIVATTQAQESGNWFWQTPEKLDQGLNTITVFAQDPESSLISENTSFNFKVKKEETSEKDDDQTTTKIHKSHQETIPDTPQAQITKPINLELEIQNPKKTVYTGNYLNLKTKLTPQKKTSGESLFKYTITDKNGRNVLEEEEIQNWNQQKIIWGKGIFIPEIFPQGEYQISVTTQIDNFKIIASQNFQIKETPLFQIGQQEISLPFLFNIISWTILILLILILFLTLMLLLEIYLSQKAQFDINGKILKKLGYFSKKKGGV